MTRYLEGSSGRLSQAKETRGETGRHPSISQSGDDGEAWRSWTPLSITEYSSELSPPSATPRSPPLERRNTGRKQAPSVAQKAKISDRLTTMPKRSPERWRSATLGIGGAAASVPGRTAAFLVPWPALVASRGGRAHGCCGGRHTVLCMWKTRAVRSREA